MNILITGSSSGIGMQLARDYLAGSNIVYCCGRNTVSLQSLIHDFPDFAQILCFDTADRNDCSERLGELPDFDLVILNAGTCEYINATNFDAELYVRVVKTNLIGTANCLEFLIPKLNPGGSLAIMGSSSCYLPLPRAEAYGASKAALINLAESLYFDFGRHNVRISLVSPGFIKTPMTDKNEFKMPFLKTPEFAADKIYNGLVNGSSFEIAFPKELTLILKYLKIFPKRYY